MLSSIDNIIFVHSIIVNDLLKEKEINPDAVAGHSLGEFSALVSAEVLTFEDALKIVKVRSLEMANAGKIVPGGKRPLQIDSTMYSSANPAGLCALYIITNRLHVYIRS